jgi:hypothetical protein
MSLMRAPGRPCHRMALTGFLRLTPHNGKEYTWHGATLLLGNAYVAAGATAIAGAAVCMWVTRRPARSVPAARATGDHLPLPLGLRHAPKGHRVAPPLVLRSTPWNGPNRSELGFLGRDGRIRTGGLLLPKQAR